MSQISTTDIAELLQLAGRTTPSGISAASRVPIGQVIQAEVLQALGDGLFKLSIGNSTLTASSQTPLNPGDQLNVETSRDSAGALSLRLVNQTTISNDRTVSAPPEQAVTLSIKSEDGADAPIDAKSARQGAALRLAGLIKPSGPLAQLVSQRPELADRIESLIRSTTEQPQSLGKEIETLHRQVDQLPTFRSVSPESKGPAETAGRLLDQLFGKNALDNPKQLAETLSTRLTSLARGLEGTIAKSSQSQAVVAESIAPRSATLPPAGAADVARPNSTVLTEPSPTSNVSSAVRAAVAEEALKLASTLTAEEPVTPPGKSEIAPSRTLGNSSGPAESPPTLDRTSPSPVARGTTVPIDDGKGANTPTLTHDEKPAPFDVSLNTKGDKGTAWASAADSSSASSKAVLQGAFDGDLKGQLLELRSQLAATAQQPPEAAPAVQQAVQRTDMLINQITGQQLRNLDGLNQYLHIQLPMDPKTGIHDAHLQVFYRQQGSRAHGTDEESDRFTVALFLNMSKLGNVLATVTGVDGTVSIGFTVDSAATKETLDHSTEELRAGLEAAGYDGAMITVREMVKSSPSDDTSQPSKDELWDDFVAQTPVSNEAGFRLDEEA